METHDLCQELQFYLQQAEKLLFAKFLNNNQTTMEHYFQKAISFFVVKVLKHFLHEYKSWDAWISMQSIDLLRYGGQRRVTSSTQKNMSLNQLYSTKWNT